MKTRFLFLGAIFTLFGLTAHAQVSEIYFQGFEPGEAVNYSVTSASNASYVTNIHSGGSRSIKLVQRTDDEVEFILDTLDFSTNTSLRYIALRFDHICRIPTNDNGPISMGMIWYKRANETNWTACSSQDYNQTGSYSTAFAQTGGFNQNSYINAEDASANWVPILNPTVSNQQWHSERFDLDNVITPAVPANERKLLIKFMLRRRTLSGTLDTSKVAWWIDNIKVSASAERMVTPKITMFDFPTLEEHPSSRGAHIELAATSSLAAGINSDSVHLYYTVGSNLTPVKVLMTPVAGVANHYETRIPFCGYDTLMRFYCSACDATGNANRVTYPPTDDSWITYRCVRGHTVQPGLETPAFAGIVNSGSNEAYMPFPGQATHRCEFVYDSAMMAEAGYGPGALLAMRFKMGANVNSAQTRQRFQVKMRNVPSDYYVDVFSMYTDFPFYKNFMKVVYDSTLTLPVMSAGLEQTINFQDTFFYAGKDLLVQITYYNPTDPASASIKLTAENAATTKQTLFFADGEAFLGLNPFTSEDLTTTNYYTVKRPSFVITEQKVQPLRHDAGISELVDPNYDVPMTVRPGSVTVKLKNFGEQTIDAVRISYSIDDTLTGFYDWAGALAANQETTVLVTSTVNIPAGFHYLKVWVEDTLTSGGLQYRDHEPYNDTSQSAFVVCDGPMGGVRNIGGSAADFNTIEEFLYSLSRCGINDSLIVRLAAGSYPSFTMPAVNGLTAQHYIVFEPQGNANVVLFSDSNQAQTCVVNLEEVANVRFRNMKFVRRNGPLTNLVTMGMNSENCFFEGCSFIDSLDNVPASLRINALLNNGYSNYLTVDSCTFIGGRIGADIKGQAPDIRGVGSVVRKSLFRGQNENALNAENQDNVVIVDNEMYDVTSNSSYVLLLNECYGSVSVERNKVYTSHGAGAIGLNNVIGTETSRAVVANNMVVCDDDGFSNLMRSPLNVIQANYLDVVYNSVKMTAPQRSNVPATTFGGTSLNNSRLVNNIIVSLDAVNYALSYQPGTSTSNELGNNVYYSNGAMLNRRATSSYVSLEQWMAAMPSDSLSLSVNPNFMNSTLVDLRTYNRAIKGAGVPFSGVSTDMFGTVRGDSVTCPGAFEFAALPYDFEIEALLNPLTDNCNMPAQTELVVLVRNSGINAFDADGSDVLQISYKLNNGAIHTYTVTQDVPADDTVTIATGQMLSMPASGTDDATYTLRVWTSFATDPNQTNDTNVFTVISRYHPAAPADDTVWISYATSATITPTTGVDTWKVYNSNSAPRRSSTLYWYDDSTAAEPFYTGPNYTTDVLHEDVTYYLRQRRNMPIVRITQVEMSHGATAEGVTSPMPYWMVESRKVAVQLTNVGDATAYLEGDTLMLVSPTSSLNNKVYTFPNVKIEPGRSLVVQYASNGVTDSSLTLRNNITSSINANANVAFVYKRNGVVEDALPLNAVITTSSSQAVTWASLNVPTYVWSGGAFSFSSVTGSAGMIRTAFGGNVNDWEFATADSPMFLGSIAPEWVRYVDNGCEGDMGHVAVKITAPPTVEIEVGEPVVPESGCGLGDEDVTVRVRNYGLDTVSNLVLNYYAGEDTVTETVVGVLPPHGDTTYTFVTKLNLSFMVDTVVNVRVWADAVAGDPMHNNDTNEVAFAAYYTPDAPDTIATRVVQYATRDTLSLPPFGNLIPVWYDFDMNPVDTGYTHETELLYAEGTRGVSYMVMNSSNVAVGTGVSLNNNTAFPSPYQPNSKFVKQQYIYSADDMITAGLTPGFLTSLSFYLDTIVGTLDKIDFLNYRIALGAIEETEFSSTTDWKNAPIEVFVRDTFTLHQEDDHAWVDHPMSSPFYWDGTSSIVVQVSYELASSINSGVRTRYTSKSNTTLHKNQNTALSPSTAGFVGTGSKGNNRPNIRFASTVYGCEGPMRTYDVQLIDMPQTDANIYWPDGFDSLDYTSCDTIALPLKLRNQGSDAIDSVVLYYYLDDNVVDSTVIVNSIPAGATADMELFHRQLLPGRHTVLAIVSVPGDSIPSNDTVRGMFTVRFCAGTYTIANDGTGDYPSFGAAIDTLNQVGILGAVTFNVYGGTYNEQVTLNNIPGSSPANTISFVGVEDSVLLTASTSQTNNYVMTIDGASNVWIENIMMEARPIQNNVNFANVLVLQNDSNINLTDCYFKVKGTILNASASCIVLQGKVKTLSVTSCVTDSGFYAMRTAGTVGEYSNFTIANNVFRDFASGGIYLRDISNVHIRDNEIRSGNSANNRGLTGVYIAESADSMYVQRNAIYLVDDKQGAKRGVQLESVTGTVTNPAFVVNNMIGTYGIDSKGLPNVNGKAASAGIVIDSSSSYVNVYFNSVRVRGTNAATASINDLTYGFFSGNTVTDIHVLNNIFANYSYGYAYYVSALNTVTNSNYNAYYTEAAKKFAWQVNTLATLAALQTANSDDGNSLLEEPYFTAYDNLHLLMTNFVGKAQYNTDVMDDIDGNVREQVPGPTIGAHEMSRLTHDMAIVRIQSPTMPVSINNPTNVETDSVKVKVTFYNNGRSNETGVTWYAFVEGYEGQTRSVTRNLGTFTPSQMKVDSVMIPTVLGIIDTQQIHVVLTTTSTDAELANNELYETFYLAPAFNLNADRMEAPSGCNLTNAQIRIFLRNEGSKPFPAGTTVKVGYHTEITSPVNVTIPTLPDTVEEYFTLANPLPIGSEVYYDFTTLANLYPTNYSNNIKVRVRGWCHYEYDITLNNDSTLATSNSKSPIKDSWYTPSAPQGHDTSFAYGTWGEVTAEQSDADQTAGRPIRWYRDTTASPFYSPSSYVSSKKWSNTPQYFHDSTYYLNCYSDKNCPSPFSEVHVNVNPRIARDMAIEEVLSPLGGRVYMENDTVRVRVANYGTAAQSNVPITYLLRRGNTIVDTVTETIAESIAPGQTLEYTFNTLLNITTPTTAQNYTLNVWTDLPNDGTRRNDTIRYIHSFASLSQDRYTPTIPSAENTKFDITRVSFNGIDFTLPPLNRSYTNLAEFTNPDYPVLHVTRGMADSILVEVTPMDATLEQFRVRATIAIDYDRDGLFADGTCTEIISDAVPFYSDSIYSTFITIPPCASLGYMRMRVKVMGYADDSPEGHVIDFLLFVDEEAPLQDLAITQMVAPRNSLLRSDQPVEVSFRIANRGMSTITSADIHYSFAGDTIDTTATGVLHWTGNLAHGQSEVVTLPAHMFPLGTSTLAIWHEMAGDADTTNNILTYEYHRSHTVILVLNDDFEGEDLWYAPTGRDAYTRNYWQRGMPNKTRIDTTYSGENAWVTDLNNNVVTGKRGNASYLYSPIIDISQVRADTISFRLRRNLTGNSSMYVEFYNYQHKWVKLDHDEAEAFYNDQENRVFTGTSSNSEGYARYYIRCSAISSDFHEKLQFRIVYTTPMGNSNTSAFGEGCAVDDFRIGRARRGTDAGVIDITKPTAPRFGQTIYPEVVVMNYGTDTLRNVSVGYTHYGTYLATMNGFTCNIAPDETDTFAFTSPFVITSDYPDSFYITAFTVLGSSDIYNDNDSVSKLFYLNPLDNDISAEELIAPLDHVIAGDSTVKVTLRVRNFGYNSISRATASYYVNGLNRVDEEIDFDSLLGRPLQSMEFYNYTFHKRLHASMGIMRVTAIIKSPNNDYIYNDTVSKRIEGIVSIMDLATSAIIVDTSDQANTRIGLIIDNRGARGANNFEVGFYYDNDSTTMVRETYYRAYPLAALTTGYYIFDRTLEPRPSVGYRFVKGFVHVLGDNDPSNDTTNVFAIQEADVEVTKVLIEENASNDCRVFVEMTNIGNIALFRQALKVRASINGDPDSNATNVQHRLDPGDTVHIELNRRIPKSPTRQYVGTGWIRPVSGDANQSNDQTSIVEVINYFEDVPSVNGEQLVLEQNYPNPFSQQTTIPFTLPNSGRVRFFIMDAMGHIVHRAEKFYQAGSHNITVDMEAYSAGVYYYGIEVDGQRQMRKMILR